MFEMYAFCKQSKSHLTAAAQGLLVSLLQNESKANGIFKRITVHIYHRPPPRYVFAPGGSGGVMVRAANAAYQRPDPVLAGACVIELLRLTPAAVGGNLFVELLQQLNAARLACKQLEEIPNR